MKLNKVHYRLFNISIQNFVESISENIDYSSIPKPILINGSKEDGVIDLVKEIASKYLCGNSDDCISTNCKICIQVKKENYPDFHLIDNDLEDKIRSTDIEEYIVNKSYISSVNPKGKVFSIINSNKMTAQAMNALLKLFEEPMPGNIYILSSNNLNKIPKTVISRCDVFTIPNLSYKQYQETCVSELGINDAKLLNKVWFIARGKIFLSDILLNEINLADEYMTDINNFINFISSPMYKKIEFSNYYLDMVKNNYSKFLFLSEVTIHVIKDIILDRHNKLQCDEITEHFKKILVKKSDFMCINIIDKLDSFDDYHEKNVNTSLIIDNLIYSI